MKHFKTLIIVLSFFLIPFIAKAQAPYMMHFQGVLVDEGGNVLYDVQEADIVFSIVDGSGEVLFSERQHLVLVSGATAALIGRGERISGDDLIDVFDTPGDKLLRVQVEGYPIPQEDAQIVHVPYAMVAERLSSDITSAQIANGTIEQEDLSETLLNYIDNLTGLTEEDLIAHRTESGAHPATSIIVENTFVNTPGTNLQQILQGIDTAIGIRTNQDGVLQGNITAEETARIDADSAHASTTSEIHGVGGGAIVGTTLTQTLTNKTLTSPDMLSPKITDNIIRRSNGNQWTIPSGNEQAFVGTSLTQMLTNKILGDTIMLGNIEMEDLRCPGGPCLVDTVDVSALKDKVDQLQEDFEDETDPSYNSVQITGHSPATPDDRRLYQDNIVAGWVRTSNVRALPLNGACSSSRIQSSFNIDCIQRVGDGGYKIHFRQNPTSGGDSATVGSYAVIGSVWGSDADDFVTVVTTRVGWFEVQVWEGTSGERDGSDSDFMVMVLGWNL